MSARILRQAEARVESYRWSGIAAPGQSPTGQTPAVPARSALAGEGSPAEGDFAAKLRDAQAGLVRAQEETRAASKQARQEGFEAGTRQAREAAEREIEAYRSELSASLLKAGTAYRNAVHRAESDLVQLSVAIAEKVLHRQLQIDADALRGVVKAASERLAGKAIHSVRVHPEDIDSVRSQLREFLASDTVKIEADAALGRGGLLFETAYGTLDYSLSSQLKEIECGLVDRIHRSTE